MSDEVQFALLSRDGACCTLKLLWRLLQRGFYWQYIGNDNDWEFLWSLLL